MSKRDFVNVIPQVKCASGQVVNMSEFKIALKHPVRSMMELCVMLSSKDAVLPVLLALGIHSKATSKEDNTRDYHALQVIKIIIATYFVPIYP